MHTKNPQRTREALIAAAYEVIKQRGVTGLTLDSVAQKAKVSKGGLLYHFESKEALVAGMLAAMIADFERELVAQFRTAGYESRPGAWTRAYILAQIATAAFDTDQSAALLAATATKPELLEPVRQHYVEWQQHAERDGLDPAITTIIRLAIDGLFLADLLDLAPPQGELRERVVAQLLELAEPPAAETPNEG